MRPSIERKKVSSQVYDELVRMIKDGEIKQNSKLPSENELAQLFGVSRSPIREALSVLAASGLIESRQGGGSWVKEVNLVNMVEKAAFEMIEIEDVYNLLEMRSIIEAEAAALAAARWKDEDVIRMEEALEAFRQTVYDKDSVGYRADYDFHRAIVKASYNPFLLQSIDQLSDLHQKALKFSLKKNLGIPRKREEVFQEHEAIFQAIKERNADKAYEEMKHHLTAARIKLGDKRVTFSPEEEVRQKRS
ncbi:FadR family transcriptional regulator [Evansella sp. LMS18]|uniref:FadR/GntR family transcriptional regulator n=1 Tax=Evansella sp. LMS18 TaxID=2924033 RepID=UPI0020D0A436|nr:FadR/GntR family transcriptional regulator [Evansella sp. LMS18]UTR11941.1 FadR family transcriptional regulator [Evansella sp. LMS18]